MAIYITEECINCGACEPECPNTAIYEGGVNWELVDKTYGEGDAAPSGAEGFYSNDLFYIVPDKCTECKGFHDEPQCAAVCPVDCCIPDPKHVESEEELLKKKDYLDSIGRVGR
ncbi:4Fe-4S dicluster domain-containing protein [bacterium BMS3Abin03]|jgi:ferredoxin|nr:4Fe-4S dicluster domain-containing protein [bacterium BMS3Abin03]MCG6959378.1 4Fe-4S dicluster domain-containing protein [bacterium BMS3Abin03]